MADSAVAITAGTGTNIDTRTEATNGDHRQVVVVGDPSVNAAVGAVENTTPGGSDYGAVVRDVVTPTISTNLGATTDAAATGNGSLIAVSKQLRVLLNGGLPTALGQTTSSASLAVVIASDNKVLTQGDIASGASDSGNPVKVGQIAATALPTAVSNGQRVGAMGDKFGRQVMLLGTIRDLVGTQTTTISASTTETTVVTAAASIFNDLMMLIVSNTSAGTNSRIDFRDTTGGTVLFSLQSIGGANPIGFSLGGASIPQTTVNTNWTAQCATSTTDIRVYAVFAKNK